MEWIISYQCLKQVINSKTKCIVQQRCKCSRWNQNMLSYYQNTNNRINILMISCLPRKKKPLSGITISQLPMIMNSARIITSWYKDFISRYLIWNRKTREISRDKAGCHGPSWNGFIVAKSYTWELLVKWSVEKILSEQMCI